MTKTRKETKSKVAEKPQTTPEVEATDTVGDDGAGVLTVTGARVNNLQNIDVTIPRNTLTVITGLSGSGKSSLAFDTIYAEGQRRYIETFSAYARNLIGNLERPDVDQITGLSPVISIEQKTVNRNPRSTVGTTTEIYDFLRLLYARVGEARSYLSGRPMVKYSREKLWILCSSNSTGTRYTSLRLWCSTARDITRNSLSSCAKRLSACTRGRRNARDSLRYEA